MPVKAMVIMAMRVGASAWENGLNNSPSTAQHTPIPAICQRERNPPASMIGNRYRKLSEKLGLMAQSTAATIATSRAAAVSARARLTARRAAAMSSMLLSYRFNILLWAMPAMAQ